MDQQTYIIEFNESSLADANRYARELQETLLDASKEIQVEVSRGEEGAQDFGSTLVLVLGTPAIIVLAKALGDWLRLRNSASIDIKGPDGHFLAKNLTSEDAASLAEKLQKGS